MNERLAAQGHARLITTRAELAAVLAKRDYADEDIAVIFWGNGWKLLEQALP